ncbi:bZIP transcription factor 44-like [Vigna radiata var. radiata]|uniref:BZIP transcription factor 44-like n=1 Tax=Vigna radiata var. radiata TaxID=3916 RepID=A0A1S3U310_VIGRR|nr:bZIP transcription factor 44-like [Vigna radiata var. radiata]
MASSSGNSFICTKIQSSGSEGDLQVLTLDERKNKRKQSNRESARRSRMRKRDHLEDLRKQVSEFTKENIEIMATIDTTTQHYLKTEAENCVLRAQMGELNQRLQSLNDIIVDIINTTTSYERDCYLTSSECFSNTVCLNQPVFQW